MYYGSQLGPMWGVERIALFGLRGRARRRRIARRIAGTLLFSALIATPGTAAGAERSHTQTSVVAMLGGPPTAR